MDGILVISGRSLLAGRARGDVAHHQLELVLRNVADEGPDLVHVHAHRGHGSHLTRDRLDAGRSIPHQGHPCERPECSTCDMGPLEGLAHQCQRADLGCNLQGALRRQPSGAGAITTAPSVLVTLSSTYGRPNASTDLNSVSLR